MLCSKFLTTYGASFVLFAVLLGGVLHHADSQQSCVDNGIVKGDTLDSTCAEKCAGAPYEVFDYAEASKDDPTTLVRNTVCRCTTGFVCWDIVDVWDLSEGVKSCDDYNITSGTKCEDFCSEMIDPLDNNYKISKGMVTCECAGIKICEGNQVDDDILANSGVAATTTAAGISLVGFILTFLFQV